MNATLLQQTVRAFNLRRYDQAARHAAEALADAQGRDEPFWMGMTETCEGYAAVMAGQADRAEPKLVSAMQKLRNFGYRYENFEVAGILAGVRLAVEELRAVKTGRKRVFDVSILPQMRLAAKADD
ncbi:MAG TPA: hypothetical protein PLQ13_13395 [Candidatus Krumholzibacteria bacterium]|nr:hypothetical protein [Candidatus Krumholzibacteria bacterium]